MEVRIIPGQERTLKVAAYCRVSTAKTQQQESFETQCRYYTRLISSNPRWHSVGIYADEGLSATTTAHRNGFNRMMEDARSGRINLILVKSVSRFSRNAVECNRAVRELKSLQVEVRFEKENISTFDPTSEFLFNINAIIAQEVSRSLSESIRWRIQRDFERGIHHLGNNMVFGYDVVDKQLVPNKDAWVIKRIFDDYLSGMTYRAICDELAALGVIGMRGAQISPSRISYILRNPVYVGDLRLQKQAPRDYLTKKPMNVDYKTYYITDDHEGIVSRDIWERTQERLRRARNKYPHFLDGKVFCGRCGEVCKRQKYYTGGEYFAWACAGMLRRKKTCKNRYIREEELLDRLCGALGTDREGLEAMCIERVTVTGTEVSVTLKSSQVSDVQGGIGGR